MSWAHAHAQQFYGRHPRDWVSPTRGLPDGTAGHWDAKADWGFLGFHPHLLRQVLRELGYESEAILGGWLQRGWLAVDNDRRRYTKKIRVGPNTTHLIVIRRAAIDAVEA